MHTWSFNVQCHALVVACQQLISKTLATAFLLRGSLMAYSLRLASFKSSVNDSVCPQNVLMLFSKQTGLAIKLAVLLPVDNSKGDQHLH